MKSMLKFRVLNIKNSIFDYENILQIHDVLINKKLYLCKNFLLIIHQDE